MHATLWDSMDLAVDVHPLGYTDRKALAIDDAGQIVGAADDIVGAWLPSGSSLTSGKRVGRAVERWQDIDRRPGAVVGMHDLGYARGAMVV